MSPPGVRMGGPSIQPFSVASVISLAQFQSIEQAQQRIDFKWAILQQNRFSIDLDLFFCLTTIVT
jgi:hypothetical protein